MSHSRSAHAIALLRASHAGPVVTVTLAATGYAVSVHRPAPGVFAVAAAVLAGQLTIGWSNDLIDADLVIADMTEHNPNVMFELGMRMAQDKPVVLIKAHGTGQIFDVDNMLRVFEYSPNLWPTTVEKDMPNLRDFVRGAWDNRGSEKSYMKIFRGAKPPERA